MNTISLITNWFCQVDLHINYRKSLLKWITIAAYFLTPEDSRDTVYREPVSAHIEYLPENAGKIKTGVWIVFGMLIALLISRLQ